jgi:hypothetical protein
MRNNRLLFVFLLWALPLDASAATISLSAGDVLSVPFSVIPSGGPGDVFVFAAGLPSTSSFGATAVVSLFDEGLLRSQTTGTAFLFDVFHSSASLYSFGTLADLSTLSDGTTHGLVQVQLLTGSATLETSFLIALGVGLGQGAFQQLVGQSTFGPITVTPAAVPEPATLTTLGVGLVVLVRKRIRAKSAATAQI